MSVTIADINRADNRLDDESVVRRTAIETNRSLDVRTGARVMLKMEHLQRTGSFKTRGAYNKMKSLQQSDCQANRVVTASAGNHAQGVALAATKTGFESTVVMPKNAPQAKVDATASYGADIEIHGQDFQEALEYAQSLLGPDEIFIPAYDDPLIIAGQGTIGIEIVDQVPDVDTVVLPIGGGGLISGVGAALSELSPETRVVGVQAQGAATVSRSLTKGSPQSCSEVRTIADGIATGGISQLTFELIEEHVDTIIEVSEAEITESVLFLLERSKQMVEGAGATTVAGLLSDKIDVRNETVVPVLSGGNVELRDLQRILSHGLADRGQLVRIEVRIDDEPGQMAEVSEVIARHDANIRNVRHERYITDLSVGEAYLDFRVETTGATQTERIITAISNEGYDVAGVSDL